MAKEPIQAMIVPYTNEVWRGQLSFEEHDQAITYRATIKQTCLERDCNGFPCCLQVGTKSYRWNETDVSLPVASVNAWEETIVECAHI